MMWVKLIALILVANMFPPQTSKIAAGAKWKQIVLLKSTRAEVEKLMGISADRGYFANYAIEEGTLVIEYSRGRCKPPVGIDWNVAADTVINVEYVPFRKQPRFSSLKIDLTRFKKRPPALHTSEVCYYNDDEGVEYTVNDDYLESVKFYPANRYASLSCGKLSQSKSAP